MQMKSLLQRQTGYNKTVYTTSLWQMEKIKEKIMINSSAQATQLQQSSQSIGEVEAQEQIRIVQQARESNRSELDSRTTEGRWP
jgi:hypothetical protein